MKKKKSPSNEDDIRQLTNEFIIPAVYGKMIECLQPLKVEAAQILESIKKEKEEYKQLLRQSELIRFKVDIGNGITANITANHFNKDEVLEIGRAHV